MLEIGSNDSTDYMQFWCSKILSTHDSAFSMVYGEVGNIYIYKLFTLYSSIYVNGRIMGG